MRVLLDENLPYDLAACLQGHSVLTVQGLGWAGLTNGELLRRASGAVDGFITMDSNLQFRQWLQVLTFGLLVLHARSSRMADLLPLADPVLAALAELTPGEIRHVGG